MVNQHGDKKKERTTVMLRPEYRELVKYLAEADDRSMGYIVDILVGEALRARGLLKDEKD